MWPLGSRPIDVDYVTVPAFHGPISAPGTLVSAYRRGRHQAFLVATTTTLLKPFTEASIWSYELIQMLCSILYERESWLMFQAEAKAV
jgi:hypothetical protein